MGKSSHKRLGLNGYLGIWLGKLLISATRLTGRGGTTLPGRLSLKLTPEILSSLSRQITKGNLVVTGTNGKTTTTALLSHILKTAGYPTVSNTTGSNLSWGIATSLIGASNWNGKLHYKYGVLEIDEGFFPRLVGPLQPIEAVITNIFPDQLDRFGEVEVVRQNIDRGLRDMPAHSLRILNADDPLLASLENFQDRTWYFGLEVPLEKKQQLSERQIQGHTCPRCRQMLLYRQVFLAHLGHYRCPGCGFERPQPQVALLDYRETSTGAAVLKLALKGRQEEIQSPLPGGYNAYNVLAGVTAALALGLPTNTIKRALSSFPRVNGRLQRITLGGDRKTLMVALIKNAVGADQALTHLLFRRGWKTGQAIWKTKNDKQEHEGEKASLLIAINDRLADGIDVSWIWNAEFERLANYREHFYTVTVSGTRAWDMAVRLKYAGLDHRRIRVEKNLEAALKSTLQATPPGKSVYILSNYTALAELNRALRQFRPQVLRSN